MACSSKGENIERFVHQPRNKEMVYENIRRKSFDNSPSSVHRLKFELFAKAGFFFAGDFDEVECYCCGLRIRDWSMDDEPIDEHAKYAYNKGSGCDFIRGNNGNVPEGGVQEHKKWMSEKIGESWRRNCTEPTGVEDEASVSLRDSKNTDRTSPELKNAVQQSNDDQVTTATRTRDNVEVTVDRLMKTNIPRRAITEWGCKEDLVREAVRQRIKDLGEEDCFPNFESLYDALGEIKNTRQQVGKPNSSGSSSDIQNSGASGSGFGIVIADRGRFRPSLGAENEGGSSLMADIRGGNGSSAGNRAGNESGPGSGDAFDQQPYEHSFVLNGVDVEKASTG